MGERDISKRGKVLFISSLNTHHTGFFDIPPLEQQGKNPGISKIWAI